MAFGTASESDDELRLSILFSSIVALLGWSLSSSLKFLSVVVVVVVVVVVIVDDVFSSTELLELLDSVEEDVPPVESEPRLSSWFDSFS